MFTDHFTAKKIGKTVKKILQCFKPDKTILITTSLLFLVSILFSGGLELLIYPQMEMISVGFPFEFAYRAAAICPSYLPSSQAAGCLEPSFNTSLVGITLNLIVFYTISVLSSELVRRHTKWL